MRPLVVMMKGGWGGGCPARTSINQALGVWYKKPRPLCKPSSQHPRSRYFHFLSGFVFFSGGGIFNPGLEPMIGIDCLGHHAFISRGCWGSASNWSQPPRRHSPGGSNCSPGLHVNHLACLRAERGLNVLVILPRVLSWTRRPRT